MSLLAIRSNEGDDVAPKTSALHNVALISGSLHEFLISMFINYRRRTLVNPSVKSNAFGSKEEMYMSRSPD